jgi:hypothetical protein
MNTKVNYVVAFYIGDNRTFPYYQEAFKQDQLCFIRKHIEFSDYAENINRFSFVINDDISEELKKEIIQLARGKNIELLFRVNNGYSYGAWNDVVKRNLNEFDYFFLIEDDYLPNFTNFSLPFIQRFKEDTAYVCSLMVEISNEINEMVPKDLGKFKHPSISNGMLSATAARKVLEKYNVIFRLQNGNTKEIGYWNQTYYLKNFTDMGYEIADTLDEFCSPYLNTLTGEVKIFGNSEHPPLLFPIRV